MSKMLEYVTHAAFATLGAVPPVEKNDHIFHVSCMEHMLKTETQT